jgi:hypothetical protein
MKRPVHETYKKLSEALGEPSELSLRKRLCLQFLKWGVTLRKEDKSEFVELAKLWRKEENRIGSPRTLLERKARKLFPKENKRKKLAPSREGASKHGLMQKEKGIGIHNPEMTAEERKASSLNAYRARVEQDNLTRTLEWIVYEIATGRSFKVRNLTRFCRENGLDGADMRNTAYGKLKQHKGWRAERYSPEWGEP